MSAMPRSAWNSGSGMTNERSAPPTTKGTPPNTSDSERRRSTSPYWMNASDELDRPNDSLMRPIFTSVVGSSGYATSGKTKMRNGTNSADPLIPTVLTTVAPRVNTANSHQYSVQ